MRTKTKILLACMGAGALLLVAAPWLVPLDGFVPIVERRAQQRLNQPVKVSRLQLYLLPVPRVVLSGITVGDKPMITIGSVSVTPSLWHLFTEVKQIRRVSVEDVTISQQALAASPGWVRSRPPGPPTVRIDRLHIRNASLQLRSITLKNLAADVQFESTGAIQEIRVTQEGDRLRVTAAPEGTGTFRLAIAARDWTLPAGPPVHFDRLDAIALLTERGISTREVKGALYDGSFRGPLSVNWKPTWEVTGELAINRVDLRPLLALFARDATLSGRLSANPHIASRSHDPTGLLPSLTLESDFQVEDGILGKVDLHAAARNPLSRNAAKSGVTRFDELSGHLEVDAVGYHFTELRIAAGLLAASGAVSVGRDRRLSGRVDAELKGTGLLTGVPLAVGGTVQDPTLTPTGAAVAGALAGSVILPGIGTAIGFKFGQLTEKLFASGRKKPEPSSRPN